MEENKNLEMEAVQQPQEEEKSSFDFSAIYTTLILNWKWFLLSLIICIGVAGIYLRYTTKMYQASAKLLIKDDDGNSRGGNSQLQNAVNLGIMSNSNGIDNEMEILTSKTIARDAVKDLKLYTTYHRHGRVTDKLMYRTQPVTVDLDEAHLNQLWYAGFNLKITKSNKGYLVQGTYTQPHGELQPATGPYQINKTLASLPAVIPTKAGYLTFSKNGREMADGEVELVSLVSPLAMAPKYAGSLGVSQTSKTTTIAQLVLTNEDGVRATDYLKQLAVVYNRQANEDKNLIAVRTEEFINGRLEKISAELGATEGDLENYKKRNKMVELKMNAGQAVTNAESYQQKLVEANTQVALLNEMQRYIEDPANKYMPIPSNVGLTDAAATSLIANYNALATERNRLLRTASENSPTVTPYTSQLDDLTASIKRAMAQARKSMAIQRASVENQFSKYQGQINETPEQERILTQIGRQQEIKSGLYLMLLQKREENSINLAATADKGKLIDEPSFNGQVSPKSSMIMLIALIMGLAIPSVILFILQFFHYKIEGHNDVAKLTHLPILADVPIASDTAKTKADIVVHENQNNLMEEIFRSLRTNLQFMLEEDQKVIAFTSSTSGEGKTFTAANLAVSFALLGKKVILVGLDIRKPRLAELFEIEDHRHGITSLLTEKNPSVEDIRSQILSSEINDNLELLLAGPTPPNPAELLARESLDIIIKKLREMYDYVILDTAPVGLVTDTLQITRVTDATVFLCRADYTPKDSFGLINSLAAEGKMPNISIVINGIDMSKKKYGYYYGYGKYAKYGKYARYGNYSRYGYGYSYGKYGGYRSYGHYGTYGSYGSYGNYTNSLYGNKDDNSIKR